MFQVINWICFICVSFLALEIIVFFCKDALQILNSTKKVSKVKSIKSSIKADSYIYENKIAK